jgi:hypothetical protein
MRPALIFPAVFIALMVAAPGTAMAGKGSAKGTRTPRTNDPATTPGVTEPSTTPTTGECVPCAAGVLGWWTG